MAMYQVGELEGFVKYDPLFDDLSNAQNEAWRLSLGKQCGPAGLWRDPEGVAELIEIWHDGFQYVAR